MEYFVTGATGFIGKRLVRKLLARPDSTVYFLTRSSELEKLESPTTGMARLPSAWPRRSRDRKSVV